MCILLGSFVLYDLPPEINRVVAWATRPSPPERFVWAEEFWGALRSALHKAAEP